MNAYPDTRWVGLRLRFEFLDPDAAELAIPYSSSQDATSHIDQCLDNNEELQKYATLELNRWGLGCGYKIMPEDISSMQTGWVCDVLSGVDGVFAVPPYLEFRFPGNQSSVGFTITFDKAANEYPSEFTVTAYDADDVVCGTIHMKTFSPKVVVPMPTLNYRRVVFTFEKTAAPYRRVRVSEVIFGIIEIFGSEDVTTASLLYELDPIAESLPSCRLSVKINNSDRRFNMINPDGIYAYLQQPQAFTVSMGIGPSKEDIQYCSMGEFYFATASAEDGGLTAEITAYDWFYWMEQGTFNNTTAGICTLAELVTSILADANIDCEVIYSNNAGTCAVNQYLVGQTHRETLRLAVQAAGCTAFFDRTGRLNITALSDSTASDVLDNNNMSEPPKVSVDEAVNTVRLVVKDEVNKKETVYTASNISEGDMPQIKTISNPLVAAVNGQAVADWLLSRCQGRLTYRTRERGNPETALTDTVRIYDFFNVNRTAVITRQLFSYDGGLSAESEAITLGA